MPARGLLAFLAAFYAIFDIAVMSRGLERELGVEGVEWRTSSSERIPTLFGARGARRVVLDVGDLSGRLGFEREREIFINQQEITTLTVIWARQLVSPQPKLAFS